MPLSLKFIIGCSLTLSIALGISFHFLAQRQAKLIMGQVETEVRVLFKQFVITRKWVADHGEHIFGTPPFDEAEPLCF